MVQPVCKHVYVSVNHIRVSLSTISNVVVYSVKNYDATSV